MMNVALASFCFECGGVTSRPRTTRPSCRADGSFKGIQMSLRSLRVAGLLALALLASSYAAAQDNTAKGSLVVAEDVVPQTFDPTQSSQIRTWYMWQLVYEGLVRADVSGKILPVLASKWTVDSSQTAFEFTLRDGVKFSDGTPVAADD